MSKRQAISGGGSTGTPSVTVPQDMLSYTKQPTDVHDDSIRILSPPNSGILVTGTGQKLTLDFSNFKMLRMNQIVLQMDLTPGFTSTSGSDNFGSILPQFVAGIWNVLDRWTLHIGNAQICDTPNAPLRNSLQYWMRSNTITRLNDLYMYASSNLAPSSAVPTTVRFPLCFDPNDFPKACGIIPSAILPKMSIDLYWSQPNACCYYTGTPVGSISLNYTIQNVQFVVEESSSSLIAASIAAKGLNTSYSEWFWVSVPINPNTQSLTVQIPARFRWASRLLAVVRKVSDILNPTLATKLKVFTSDVTEVKSLNVRLNSILRYQEPLVGSLACQYELKKNFPSVKECDYFQNITTNGTSQSVYGLRLGNCISPELESGVSLADLSGSCQLEITWASALGNTNYVMDIFILHSRYIYISPKGAVDVQD